MESVLRTIGPRAIHRHGAAPMTGILPSTPVLLAFAAAALATLIVPGPSVLYVVTCSMAHGRRAGLYAVLGLETGTTVHAVAATVGLTAVLGTSTTALSVVRWAGALLLVWLAVREFRTIRDTAHGRPAAAGHGRRTQIYTGAALIDLLNPNTVLFFLAFLPQFVDPSRGSVGGQVAVLGACYVALAAPVETSYALLGSRLTRRLRESPRASGHLNIATGGIYLTLAGAAVVV